MARSRLTLALLLPLAAAAGVPAQEPPAPPESPLVTARTGDFPVVISAPHGGAKDVPDVPVRKGVGLAVGPEGFFTARDVGSEELAAGIVAAIEEKTGKKPYVVSAKFHRKYLDANRPAEIGCEDPKAKPVYDAYHGTLAAYCKEVRKKHGRGLLLDVHGQGMFPGLVMRGTWDGKTVALLRERFGDKAHTGPDSFFGLLAASGLKVHPPRLDLPEYPGMNGGYIVQTYGSGDYGIDAIQLEFGTHFSHPKAAGGTAKQVAGAVARFHDLYLVDKK